jgi:TPR repeat protein
MMLILGERPLFAQQRQFETLDQLKKLAEGGDLEAEFQLGFAYANPKRTDINPPETAGIAPDLVEAEKWLGKAAEHDYAPAESELGALLARGALGGDRIGEALNWVRKAADKRSAPAETMLGVMLYYGEISTVRTFHVPTTQDKAEGLRWLHKGEADGDYRAHDELRTIAMAEEHQAREAAEKTAFIQRTAIATGTVIAAAAIVVTLYLTVWKNLTEWLQANAERRRQ